MLCSLPAVSHSSTSALRAFAAWMGAPYPADELPWIVLTRLVCLAVPLGYALMVRHAWRK